MTVRQDDVGRYNLNDLHKAAGGRKADQPADFFKRDEAKALVSELAKSAKAQNYPVNAKRGRYGGTFVVKELVYVYALCGSLRASILHLGNPTASPCSVAPESTL
ncbi:KilA-N domain-containing protein [Halomonas ramblicola]|uniref:KilA-N domain-containing protein n=1 Tax=Halomonas ramblicola TaxID=747349 RepID=UPI0025B341A9|nr:KilA-N domain-containing protein [Halomonas ramblicola]MDN3520820.1 KilA-N domain-containing protein [Halomonas ramblicola]